MPPHPLPLPSRGRGKYLSEAKISGWGEVYLDWRVARYNLAYINHAIFQGDHGRVIGYDNAHGTHHRHAFGKREPVTWTCFEEIEDAFQKDWLALHRADRP